MPLDWQSMGGGHHWSWVSIEKLWEQIPQVRVRFGMKAVCYVTGQVTLRNQSCLTKISGPIQAPIADFCFVTITITKSDKRKQICSTVMWQTKGMIDSAVRQRTDGRKREWEVRWDPTVIWQAPVLLRLQQQAFWRRRSRHPAVSLTCHYRHCRKTL